jgi:hypothetical protein
MKIWFGTTTAQWRQYKKYYFLLRDYLKQSGCTIIFDWLNEADEFYETSHKNRNIRKVYERVITAINESEACIIEYTVPNFSSSHQINYALLKKKPTLVLRLKKDNPRFNDSYLDAIQSPLLTINSYNESNYQQIITDFIQYCTLDTDAKRYNIVLGKKQKYYLDWAAKTQQKSRSQIIRDLIERRIKQDHKYQKEYATPNIDTPKKRD